MGFIPIDPEIVVALSDEFFDEADYNKILAYIRAKSEIVHKTLVECESDLGLPCIRLVTDSDKQGFILPQVFNNGYAAINLTPFPGASSTRAQIDAYKSDLDFMIQAYQDSILAYGFIMPIENRKQVLEIIRSIEPPLADILLESDPTLSTHIRYRENSGMLATVNYSRVNYLPTFTIDLRFFTLPEDQQRFVIGHELGHYVLGHILLLPKKGSPMEWIRTYSPGSPKREIEEDSRLFENARLRLNEYEADQFSVVQFGSSIDSAITLIESTKDDHPDMPGLKSLDSTHPLFLERISELGKLSENLKVLARRPKKPIDWRSHAREYKLLDSGFVPDLKFD